MLPQLTVTTQWLGERLLSWFGRFIRKIRRSSWIQRYCLSPDLNIASFIHSGHFYSAPSSPLPLRGAPDYSTDTALEFHAEAHRQLQVKKGLAQGPYVTARAGVEPMTLRLKVIDSTKAPSRPTMVHHYIHRIYFNGSRPIFCRPLVHYLDEFTKEIDSLLYKITKE